MFKFSSLDTGSRQFIISFLADFSNCIISPLVLSAGATAIRSKFFFLNWFGKIKVEKKD